MSDNTIDVYGKQVPTNLLLEYAYQIASGEIGKARSEAHKAICEAVAEP